MVINGIVHCLFEQSGTFKNVFRELGYSAYDYDIDDQFGQTDIRIDLFEQIERAYVGDSSIFDDFTKDDLLISFFPCIYFSGLSQMNMSLNAKNNRSLPFRDRFDVILKRSSNRERYWCLLVKLFAIAFIRGFRLIVENPWSFQTFLRSGFILPPSYVDHDRTLRGDFFVKPTAYWFVNCSPGSGESFVDFPTKSSKDILHSRKAPKAGLCSIDRSLISDLYAKNFIHDLILDDSSQNHLF